MAGLKCNQRLRFQTDPLRLGPNFAVWLGGPGFLLPLYHCFYAGYLCPNQFESSPRRVVTEFSWLRARERGISTIEMEGLPCLTTLSRLQGLEPLITHRSP